MVMLVRLQEAMVKLEEQQRGAKKNTCTLEIQQSRYRTLFILEEKRKYR